MRYFISFFFLFNLFLNPTLKAATSDTEQTHKTQGEIYKEKKEQVDLYEDSNDLFNMTVC